MEKADRYFDENLFTQAIKYYEAETKSKNKKNKEKAFKRLADCYRITGEFESAEELYRKIIKKYRKDPLNYLNYGLSLKSSAKFAEATLQFQDYCKMAPNDPMGPVYLASCDSAQRWLDESLGKEVKNMVSINSDQSDFSPVLLPDGRVLFCSARPGSKQAFVSFDGGNQQTRLDLYLADLDKIKAVARVETPLARMKAVTTPAHEGPACISHDGKHVYYTKTVKGKKNKSKNSIVSTLQIYHADIDSLGNWTNPVSAFNFNSFEYSIAHPSISQDGNTIYFMSDKPGGMGKTDIYWSVKDSTGNWQEPVNAGSTVNTFGYELFPFIANDNTLYFSSNAHAGMGQLDIFCAKKTHGSFDIIQNLKPPINSIGNDFGITIDSETGYGLFSSDRFNGKGAEDIYSFSTDRAPAIEMRQDTLVITDLRLFDDFNYLLSEDSSGFAVLWAAKNGRFTAVLDENKTYKLSIKKHGLKMTDVLLSYHKNNTQGPYQFNCRSLKSPLLVKAYYQGEAEQHLAPSIARWQTLQAGEINMNLDKSNLFTFQALLEPQQQLEIRADDPIRKQ